jgi:hypothetical protein
LVGPITMACGKSKQLSWAPALLAWLADYVAMPEQWLATPERRK